MLAISLITWQLGGKVQCVPYRPVSTPRTFSPHVWTLWVSNWMLWSPLCTGKITPWLLKERINNSFKFCQEHATLLYLPSHPHIPFCILVCHQILNWQQWCLLLKIASSAFTRSPSLCWVLTFSCGARQSIDVWSLPRTTRPSLSLFLACEQNHFLILIWSDSWLLHIPVHQTHVGRAETSLGSSWDLIKVINVFLVLFSLQNFK